MLAIYFSAVVGSGYNYVAYSSIGQSVAKSFGFIQKDGKTGDSYYIDLLPMVYLALFLPFNFLSVFMLEKKGLRATVSLCFTFKLILAAIMEIGGGWLKCVVWSGKTAMIPMYVGSCI